MSYDGLINKRMGFRLPMSYQGYKHIAENINITEMPIFPKDGYITKMDDHTIVIKISEYRDYAGQSKYVID